MDKYVIRLKGSPGLRSKHQSLKVPCHLFGDYQSLKDFSDFTGDEQSLKVPGDLSGDRQSLKDSSDLPDDHQSFVRSSPVFLGTHETKEGKGLITYNRRKRKNPEVRKLDKPNASGAETDVTSNVEPGAYNSKKMVGNLIREPVDFGTSSTIKAWKWGTCVQKTLAPKRILGQYFLDLGQSDFSYSTCQTCGLLYARGHENDEKVHKSFHRNFTQGIQFKGWQKERVASRLDDKGNRVIIVLQEDTHHKKKVREVIDVMELELGLTPGWLLERSCKVYLFISSSKKIVGCLMAEPIKSAFRVVSTQYQSSANPNEINQWNVKEEKPSILKTLPKVAPDTSYRCPRNPAETSHWDTKEEKPLIPKTKPEAAPETSYSDLDKCALELEGVHDADSQKSRKHKSNVMIFGNINFSRETVVRKRVRKEQTRDLGSVILCTKTPVPAVCGVRVIWVSHSERRKGIASHLLDAMRKSFSLGVVLEPSQFAFSQPTPKGRKFAAQYCKTNEFLVYTTS